MKLLEEKNVHHLAAMLKFSFSIKKFLPRIWDD